MTPLDAVLARLEEIASRPRVGVHSDQLYLFAAALRLNLLRPKCEPDVGDRVPGFLERRYMKGEAVGWIPVDAIVTDRAHRGWGDFDYREDVVPSIWGSAASADTRERRVAFLECFGVVAVDEYVIGSRSIFVPRGNGHHRVGAAKLLELPFVRATINETVSIAPELVVAQHFAEVRLMGAVWEACFERGLTPTPPVVDADGAVRIRVNPASAAPWVLLRPDQAASIGQAAQTHVPLLGAGVPGVDDLASWQDWLRWLGVAEDAAAGVPLQDADPDEASEENPWTRELLPPLPPALL